MIYQGDALDVLTRLPENSVQCVVTSPPYWGLRDYGVAGQLGLEATGVHGPLQPRKDNTALVVAALTLQPLQTMAELAGVTGIGHQAANAGLDYLRKTGRLGSRERAGTWSNRLRRPVWEYWLLDGAQA